jgi:F-type H+-transporting ATPase subunit delta
VILAESTLQSKRYSQAVFEIAKENNELDKWKNDLERISSLAQNRELVSIMENPKFSFEDKSKLLNNQLRGLSQKALNLAYIMTNRGKFSLITAVYNDYQQFLDILRGIDKAEVTTAVPLDEAEKAKLAQHLGTITGKNIEIIEKVDPTIIGGMIARVGGKIIDGSTSSQLAALKNELANTGS